MFALPRGVKPDLSICKDRYGYFKEEYKDIQSIAQLGINTCSILHKVDGLDVVTMKTGGFQQQDQLSGNVLSHRVFIQAVEASIHHHFSKAAPDVDEADDGRAITAKHICTTTQGGLKTKKEMRQQTLTMQSALTRRHLVDQSYPFRTEPYGFLPDSKHKFCNPFAGIN